MASESVKHLSFPTIAGQHQLKWSLSGYHPHEAELVLLKGSELNEKRIKLIPIASAPIAKVDAKQPMRDLSAQQANTAAAKRRRHLGPL